MASQRTTKAKTNGNGAAPASPPHLVIFLVDGDPQVNLGEIDINAAPTLLRRAALLIEHKLGLST